MMTTLRFEQVNSVDSTNAELMRRDTDAQDDTPIALWALRQTAGRGRRGRTWLSDPEDSITLSVAVCTPAPVRALLGLPLAVGVCLAQTLESFGARSVALKWPNDLYTRHAGGWCKSGGILTEVRSLQTPPSGQRADMAPRHRVVCGFGLNLFAPPAGLDQPGEDAAEGAPDPLGEGALASPQPAGALFEGRARETLDRPRLAQALARAVAECMQTYPDAGFEAWRSGWQPRDLLAGRWIQVHHADASVLRARALGVDAQGALDIEDQTGRRSTLASGEVSVRLGPQDLAPWPAPSASTPLPPADPPPADLHPHHLSHSRRPP
jgi:BirA family biotin operon repressor/biotin-[acetyl-CoA-carboxylase] ligase